MDKSRDSHATLRSISSPSWADRILSLAVFGILFLTLYPFQFNFHVNLPPGHPPIFLGTTYRISGFGDFTLNVLLFIPFGFGLAEQLLERSWKAKAAFYTTWAAGLALSYFVELSQLYIPGRDSGWEDVFTNSTGAALGFVLFHYAGGAVLASLRTLENWFRVSLTIGRTALLVAVYAALWFALSAYLQQDTNLSDWTSQASLFIGGDPPSRGASAWKGSMSLVQIWDHAIPTREAEKLTSASAPIPNPPSASFDFTGGPPYRDTKSALPDLVWIGHAPFPDSSAAPNFSGRNLLASSSAVSILVDAIRKTNQFSIHFVGAASEVAPQGERVICLMQPFGPVNMHVQQDQTSMVLWLRNPITARRAFLAWYIPNVFIPGKTRNVLVTYDGADFAATVDGVTYPRHYRLGPGTRAAEIFRRVIPAELDGYTYLYEALIFGPVGLLLGLGTIRGDSRQKLGLVILVAATVASPLIYQLTLSRVSHRPILLHFLIVEMALILLAAFWINADGEHGRAASSHAHVA